MRRADLHRHVEGSLRPRTILELAREHGVRLPADDIGSLLPFLRVEAAGIGLPGFLEKFRWPTSVLADLAACRRVGRECVEDAAAENLSRLELRFSPAFMAARHGLDAADVAGAVLDGIQEGSRATGLPVVAIGILSCGYGPDRAWEELDAILAHRGRFAAVDLAGDEARFDCRLFERHFERARATGLRVTVHAGEARGPSSVRDAVERLGAERIGHATRASEDFALLDLLGARGIGLECCLTSNLQTGAVRSLRAHPLRLFLEAGLLATINTDDPAISGINLDHELTVAAPAAGVGGSLLAKAADNAFRIAFGVAGASTPREGLA